MILVFSTQTHRIITRLITMRSQPIVLRMLCFIVVVVVVVVVVVFVVVIDPNVDVVV